MSEGTVTVKANGRFSLGDSSLAGRCYVTPRGIRDQFAGSAPLAASAGFTTVKATGGSSLRYGSDRSCQRLAHTCHTTHADVAHVSLDSGGCRARPKRYVLGQSPSVARGCHFDGSRGRFHLGVAPSFEGVLRNEFQSGIRLLL